MGDSYAAIGVLTDRINDVLKGQERIEGKVDKMTVAVAGADGRLAELERKHKTCNDAVFGHLRAHGEVWGAKTKDISPRVAPFYRFVVEHPKRNFCLGMLIGVSLLSWGNPAGAKSLFIKAVELWVGVK